MKKIIKRISLLILIIFAISVSVTVVKGYELYKEVTDKVSVPDKIEEARDIKNYTTIDELPPFYIKAVLAVEDSRFYSHFGIDIISIMRAAKKRYIVIKLKRRRQHDNSTACEKLLFFK